MSSGHAFSCRFVLLSLVILCATSLGLAQVEITAPANGETVRGQINVTGTKTDPAHGWISYKLEGPGQSGDFTTAVVQPFRLVWDSVSADDSGKRRFPDGEYTITAVGHLPSGQKLGQASVRVTLKNDLDSDAHPATVTLVADYKRGRELTGEAIGRARTKLIEHDDFHAKVIDLYGGLLEAQWRERAMSNSAGVSAIVRFYFDKGYTILQGSMPSNLPRAGDIFTLNIDSRAKVSTRRKDDKIFELGTLDLQLPDQAVRRGSTWKSSMHVIPLLGADRRTVTGNHRVDGFQWVAGRKCVRIVSTYSENDVELKVQMGQSATPQAGMGMDMGMLEIPDLAFFAPPDLAMPPPGDMGPIVEGATPASTVSVSAPVTSTVTSSYTGTRVSYFAYEMSQFVRSEDFVSHKLTIDSSQFGGGAQRGMGGMWDDPMMMGDMYGPGGIMHQLTEPDAEVHPWEVPGMPGPQQQQIEVKKEFEATAQVSMVVNRR